jgi:catechol 2,3-dioxygenase-like lactoylglutathione lyase family enzyme
MQTRLTHVRATVSDLEKAIEWYGTVLEFEVNHLWPPDAPSYADFISQEGAVFSVGLDGPTPIGARFNFLVEDVDDLYKCLKDKVEVVEPLYDTRHGTRKFTIRDPDGNQLGFVKG